MSAPTIKVNIAADSVQFDNSMKRVSDTLKSTSEEMKSFGKSVDGVAKKSIVDLGSTLQSTSEKFAPLINSMTVAGLSANDLGGAVSSSSFQISSSISESAKKSTLSFTAMSDSTSDFDSTFSQAASNIFDSTISVSTAIKAMDKGISSATNKSESSLTDLFNTSSKMSGAFDQSANSIKGSMDQVSRSIKSIEQTSSVTSNETTGNFNAIVSASGIMADAFKDSASKIKGSMSKASGYLKDFGNSVKQGGIDKLKNFQESIKDTVNNLKPLAKKIGDVTAKFAKWGAASVAAAGVAGAAIIATSLSSIKELKNLSVMSDVSTASLQRGAFAAASVGVEFEEYAQALKDVNDRLGDFNATGAGPMVDFFEKIAPLVNVTAASFEGLNSEQSLALYVKSLEDANVSQAEMTFYMEAIAGDATKLIPLFANNAKQMKAMKKEAKELGIGLSEIDVKQAMNAQSQLAKVGAIIKNELLAAVVELAPFITAVSKMMVDWFKGVRKDGDGLASGIQAIAISIVGYIDTIANVFAYIGKGFDILKGIVFSFVGTLKMAVGAAMQIIATIIKPVFETILEQTQFVSNAFNEGFGSGMVNTLKGLNLAITDFLLTPIEYLFELMAKLPSDFGGDLFKASLRDVKAMRDNTAKLKSDLHAEVITPNLDLDTPMGKLNAIFEEMKGNAAKVSSNIFGAGGDLITEGYALGLEGGASLTQGLMDNLNSGGSKEALQKFFADVKAQVVNKPEDGSNNGDPPLEEVSMPNQAKTEELSPVAQFYAETEKLLEAELFRFQSQNEIQNQQYNNEIQMLMDKQATEEGLTQTQEDKLNALKKKSVEINKQLAKESMMSGIRMLLEGSGKASKIMKKFAIVQAIIKGKEAAVSAWSAGMSTGGPFAPLVAAAYTTASIARTAGMINAIRGGGSSSGGGGGGSSAVASAQTQGNGGGSPAQAAPVQSSRIFNVEFMGQSSTSTQQTRNLLELINEQAGDNVTINMRGG